jgi:hypothetical protein
MAVTASSMIISALVKNGEKVIGDTLTSAEQTAYLSMLQAMIDSWGLERGWCIGILEETFTLTVSTGSYSIGVGGAFNTNRPNHIVNAFVRDTSNYDHEITVLPQEQFALIAAKSAYSEFPSKLYYDNSYSSTSTGLITFWPVPTKTYTLHLQSWQQLQTFPNVTTALQLPPGYQRAIEFNFAIEASPGLKSVPPEVIRVAKEAKAAIKGLNLPDVIMRPDTGLVKRNRGNVLDGP